MYAQVKTGSLAGLEGALVTVEADLSNGLPGLNIVGLPDRSVKEAKERIRSAFLNSGLRLPSKRITINLSPADVRKEGTHFDLPIAMGIAASFLKLTEQDTSEFAFLGELSLNGEINAVKGALPIIIELRKRGIAKFILPRGNLKESGLIKDCKFYPADHLKEVLDHFGLEGSCLAVANPPAEERMSEGFTDFSQVDGQEDVKRMFVIAAAGCHNLLLSGPPGTGKSMMARRMSTILPPLSYEERLEVTKIYSAAGLLKKEDVLLSRPFCDPHHTATAVSLLGGGASVTPGQVTLAHRGVLFLDELAEFQKRTLDCLRQPLEDKQVVIVRNSVKYVFPANFLLLAAMNPCPCGYLGHKVRDCRCTPYQIQQYKGRLSGPLLDRIDLFANIQPVPFESMSEEQNSGTSSEVMRQQVLQARQMQRDRYKSDDISHNSQLYGQLLKHHCKLDGKCKKLMADACQRFQISGRGYGKILKTARTIADLESVPHIRQHHLAEAIQYCIFDKSNMFE